MKFSLQEHLVPGNTLEEKGIWLETNGFAGIELWAFDIAERLPHVKEVFARSPLRITSLVGGYDGHLFHPSPQVRQEAVSGVQRLLHDAGEIEAGGVIVIPSFGISRSPGVLSPHLSATTQDIETFGSTLALLAQEAKAANVTLYVEVINRYESFAFNRIEEVAQAIHYSSSSHLKLLIDTFHMNIEESSCIKAITQHAPLIGYVHLSDSNRRPPGQGHFPFQPFLHTLKSIDYTGYMTMECFADHPDELLAAKRYLKAMLDAQGVQP